jgi:hypothetical protein
MATTVAPVATAARGQADLVRAGAVDAHPGTVEWSVGPGRSGEHALVGQGANDRGIKTHGAARIGVAKRSQVVGGHTFGGIEENPAIA